MLRGASLPCFAGSSIPMSILTRWCISALPALLWGFFCPYVHINVCHMEGSVRVGGKRGVPSSFPFILSEIQAQCTSLQVELAFLWEAENCGLTGLHSRDEKGRGVVRNTYLSVCSSPALQK